MIYSRLITAALLLRAHIVLGSAYSDLNKLDDADETTAKRSHPSVRVRASPQNDVNQDAAPPRNHRALQSHDWTDQIEAFKPSVVNVETSSEIVLETEETGTSTATGFIVDAERGIIVTNRHVTGTSPSFVIISFYDGSFTEAKILYYDPTHDFGFYKFDPDDVLFDVQGVEIGSGRDGVGLGDEVLMIGNNDAEEYSIKFGRVANLKVNKGDRHSSYIHTTFDRAGGSSGSPVWDTAGQVIGIHARGSDTSSFELPIDYVADALVKLQNGEQITRGEIGVDLELISIGEAITHYSVPETAQEEIGPSDTGTPKVIQVESIIPRTSGVGVLRAADIIYRINGALIRDDLYQFDAILNKQVGQNTTLDIYRNGVLKTVKVFVEDMENKKVRRFLRFAGATFHDVTPELRRMLYLATDGVFMSHVDSGSTFGRIGRVRDEGNTKIVIIEINGKQIDNLSDFILACSELEDGQHTYVNRRDMNAYDTSPTPKSLSVRTMYEGLEVFVWNETELDWNLSE